ncbi:cyclin-K-like [Helianthus annuus]|uniref:cyclin-K-like n=1 Tax=Helianthus annuus TaxID=4232 RepID=UPI0016530B6B|nr:cyclin-K-like [Helianthus annuus]
MELIRVMVDARYKDTQADISDDDGDGDGDDPKPKVQQQPKSAKQQSAAKASYAGKKKGINETLNKKAEEIALEKQKKQDTEENVSQTAVKTPVVSADVSLSSATINLNTPSTQPPPTPQRFPSHPPSPPKQPPPPKIAYVRKRKTFVLQQDDEEIPSPIPLSSAPMQTIPSSSLPPKSTLTPPIGSLPSVIPLAAKYPLELLTVQGEIESFFKIEDLSKRTFPSLYDFRKPQNLDEYLKMKVRQR